MTQDTGQDRGRATARESGPRVVVMGVSGSGKSTIAAGLAERLGVPFEDGDDLHPPANVAKMAAGTPLDDADREPWLDAVGRWLAAQADGGVIACSALKRAYRDRLRGHAGTAYLVHLHGPQELIARRQRARRGHFMPPGLLDSQFATLEPLEPDEAGVVLDVGAGVDDLVQAAYDAVRTAGEPR